MTLERRYSNYILWARLGHWKSWVDFFVFYVLDLIQNGMLSGPFSDFAFSGRRRQRNYIQRNPEVAFYRHDPPHPSIRDVDDVFHVELGRGDWKSRKIVVDELFQSMSAILRTCRREIDFLGQLTKNLEIQRKERR